MNGRQKLIFHHIPKTAGTTLYSVIDESFNGKIYTVSGNQLEHQQSIQNFIAMSSEEKNSYDLIKGHRTYGLHTELDPPVKYFTVLRLPAQRHISGYFQLLKVRPDLPERKAFVENPPTLEEYIKKGDIYYGQNPQLKTFLNIPDPDYKITAADLEIAVHKLKDEFVLVGLTERFDETCVLLNQLDGFHIRHYLNKNVAKNYERGKISPGLIDLYDSTHPYDIEFYQVAEKLFAQKWEALMDKDRLLEEFRNGNLAWNKKAGRKEKFKSIFRKILKR